MRESKFPRCRLSFRCEVRLPKGRVSAARSRNMAAIKGRDTKPELTVRSALHRAGLRFRLHRKELPGRPDIVLPRFRVVVFVHGCFWHKHNCSRFVWPQTRQKFWRAKLLANVARDRRNRRLLRQLGWRIEQVWECQIASRQLDALVSRIREDVSD